MHGYEKSIDFFSKGEFTGLTAVVYAPCHVGLFGLFVVIFVLKAKKYLLEPTRAPYGNNQGF